MEENNFDLSAFEKEIIEIADYICEYGIRESKIDFSLYKDFNQVPKEVFSNFKIKCHDGFKLGQDLIVKNLLDLQQKELLLKKELKIFNVNKDKAQADLANKKLKFLKYQSEILRQLADTLAWQLLKGQLYIARRLYTEELDNKSLLESNFSSVEATVKSINQNPQSFALITDITSYVQIGDIISVDEDSIKIIEVKQGEKNEEVGLIVKEIIANNMNIDEINKDKKHSPATEKQIKRYYRQLEKGKRVIDIIKNDQGVEPKSGKSIRIHTPEIPTQTYIEVLQKMKSDLDSGKEWAFEIIEDCVKIGMYKGEKRFSGVYILKQLSEKEDSNFALFDFSSIIHQIQLPLLLRPFEKEFLFDLLFQRVKLFYSIDIDALIELYKSFGFDIRWATQKETMQYKQQEKGSGLFELKGRGIIIKDATQKESLWIGAGTILKIIYEHYLPSYTAYTTSLSLS